ncbi:MAG: sigma-54 dependent transcriptional regulator [Candidatus Magnetoovum sp. WYHC-5]|nr:sigma-54 dependent transcriptional regulator [Candidatus Magnetoovum sp. WYHC-5]
MGRRKKSIKITLEHYKLLKFLNQPLLSTGRRRRKRKGGGGEDIDSVTYYPSIIESGQYGKVDEKTPIYTSYYKKLISESQSMKRVINKIRKVSMSDFSVIIEGETGTGKTLIAHAIHELSPRCKEPFVHIDLSAIPETLMESVIFGHEKGAFTGADNKRKGVFRNANKGTVFIDELQNLTNNVQIKLLTVIEEKRFYAIGSSRSVTVDLRILCATNKDLQAEADSGKLREDLYYRLSEFVIELPPLRERKEDITSLADDFLNDACSELGLREKYFADSATDFLLNYEWPGNIRQLKNVVRRAVLECDTNEISRKDFENILTSKKKGDEEPQVLPLKNVTAKALREVESKAIRRALKLNGGNKSKAAIQLEIDYKTLLTKIKDYSITNY